MYLSLISGSITRRIKEWNRKRDSPGADSKDCRWKTSAVSTENETFESWLVARRRDMKYKSLPSQVNQTESDICWQMISKPFNLSPMNYLSSRQAIGGYRSNKFSWRRGIDIFQSDRSWNPWVTDSEHKHRSDARASMGKHDLSILERNERLPCLQCALGIDGVHSMQQTLLPGTLDPLRGLGSSLSHWTQCKPPVPSPASSGTQFQVGDD
jgi:hypothetical protein